MKSLRKYNIILIIAIIAVLFVGCGDDDEQQVSGISTGASTMKESVLSEVEQNIKDYENRYGTGEFTREDYYALSELYKEQGLIRRQRDILEQSYRLYDDTQAFETLQNI